MRISSSKLSWLLVVRMKKYDARFEIDLGDRSVFLDTLKNISGVVIGSLFSDRFYPVAFCLSNVVSIIPLENESGDYEPEDLIELAAYVMDCNKEE